MKRNSELLLSGAGSKHNNVGQLRDIDINKMKQNCHYDVSEASKELPTNSLPGQLRLKDKVSQSLFMTYARPVAFSTSSALRQKPIANTANAVPTQAR